MPALYTLAKLIVAPVIRRSWRANIEGLEHLPSTGAVLAGNHLSVADELMLGVAVPRHISFWAKSEYFSGSGFKGWFSRFLVSGVGAIPVERQGGRAILAAFKSAIPVLQGGGFVAVYPEGTRSPDGRLYQGHTGAVRLAMSGGVPIVPVGTLGTGEVQPIGARMPHLNGKVTIRFGKPIDLTEYSQDPAGIRAATDRLMSEIQALTGQEYVSSYAPRKPRTSSPADTPATG